jgi:site-specific recombinase XerD
MLDAVQAGATVWSDGELADRFLASCSRTNSAETRASYALDLRHFAAWLQLHHPGVALRCLDPSAAADYVAHLGELVTAGRIRPRTHNRRLSTVSALWRWASDPTRSGVSGIARSIWPRRAMLATAKTSRAISPSDLDTVLGVIQAAALAGNRKAARDYVLTRATYLVGCRVSEMCRLRWADLERLPDGGGQVHLFGKGSRPRTVRISADTLALFESLGRGPDDAWLFPGRRGHITRQAVCDRMARWGRRAGTHLHPHKLRHAHASRAVQMGVDVFCLQATLGHQSTATTSGYVASNPATSSSLRLG